MLTVTVLVVLALVAALGGILAAVHDWRAEVEAVSVGRSAAQAAQAAQGLEQRVRAAAFTSAGIALVAVVVGSWLGVRRALRPLDDLAVVASGIGAGDSGRRVPTSGQPVEVERLAVSLNAMLERLDTALTDLSVSEARLRRFVADAAHELRTPVTTIRGYAELFRRGARHDPEELPKVVSRIESEAARMGDLVDDLVALARLDERRALDPAEVDLALLAEDAAMDVRAVDPAREVDVRAAGAVVVRGDEAALRQVLANLLANVMRHTPPGTRADVRVEATGRWAVVEVEDDGPGLSAEQRAHVFDRFYRVDSGRARADGGSGLGLSIVAAIVNAHGGDVGVRPGPTGGAVFAVRLPVGEV